jgi:hypothetical protein
MISPKTRTLAFILASFLLGGIAGGFIGRSYFAPHGPGRSSRTDVMKEFTQKLQLSPDQAVAVDSILEVHRSKFGAIRKSYSEAARTQRDSLRQEIRKILSGEQHALFDRYVKEMDERESRFRKPNP